MGIAWFGRVKNCILWIICYVKKFQKPSYKCLWVHTFSWASLPSQGNFYFENSISLQSYCSKTYKPTSSSLAELKDFSCYIYPFISLSERIFTQQMNFQTKALSTLRFVLMSFWEDFRMNFLELSIQSLNQ